MLDIRKNIIHVWDLTVMLVYSQCCGLLVLCIRQGCTELSNVFVTLFDEVIHMDSKVYELLSTKRKSFQRDGLNFMIGVPINSVG